MSNPLILYDLAPITNPSFESDTTDGTSPPTGWSTNATTGDTAEVDTAEYFTRGSNEGSKSAKVAEGTSSDVYLRQDVSWIPPVGTNVYLRGVYYLPTVPVVNQMRVRLAELSGSSELAATVEDVTPTQGAWTPFSVSRTTNQTSADGIRIELMNRNSNPIWFDYLHLGRALTFDNPEFRDFDVRPQHRSVINVGSGAYEGIEVGDPYTDCGGTIQRVTVDSTFDIALKDFLGWARAYRRFAFWLDFSDSTNEGLHFSECILRDAFRQKHPSGAARYATALYFTAPKEWVQQEET